MGGMMLNPERVNEIFVQVLSLVGTFVGLFLQYILCMEPTFQPFYCELPPPPPEPGFQLRIVNMGDNTDFDDVFEVAARRWEAIIVNDLPDIDRSFFPNGDIFNGFFNQPLLEPVDDMIIGYEFAELNGAILGRAGPRYIRANTGTTIAGIMQFNLDYFSRNTYNDNLVIILHEMGHVFGLGIRWDNARCDSGCRVGAGSFTYTCSGALNAYRELDLQSPIGTGNVLKVADDGGAGSACSHWDDESFKSRRWSEVMTPFFDPGKPQLITAVSALSLTDIADYRVNLRAVDIPPTSTSTLIGPVEAEDGFSTDNLIDLTIEDFERIEPELILGF